VEVKVNISASRLQTSAAMKAWLPLNVAGVGDEQE
jgi:hypothetical protein